MKKYLFLIGLISVSVMMTGCFGKEGKGVLNASCTKEEDSYNLKEVNTYEIEYFKGEISSIVLTKSFSGTDLSKTLDTYKKAYDTFDGVSSEIGDNKIIYTFDMTKVNDEVRQIFKLKSNYNEQIKTLEKEGFTCN